MHGISQGAVGLPDLLPSPGDSPFADCCLQAPAKAALTTRAVPVAPPVAWTFPCLHVQSCSTLCNPVDCSPPGPSVHGVSKARILEWVAIPVSRGSSRPRDRTRGLLNCRQILYCLNHQGADLILCYLLKF